MTVIAAFSLGGCPILFGDLLTTGPVESITPTVSLPAVGDAQDFFGTSGWAITGLHQKVTLIGDNCIVAWAGSWLGAKTAISALKLLSQKTRLTVDVILKYLENDKDLQKHTASFVGFVMEDEGLRQFHFQADHFESASLGTVYLCGSGSKAIHEFSNMLVDMEMKATGEVNIAVNAVSCSLMLGGILLQSEFHGGYAATTLMNMFGGGYEIASYLNGKFQKLSDLTYVFWVAEQQKEGIKLSLPQFVVKQKYIDDFLFVRSARVEASVQGVELKIKDEQYHVICPMYESNIDIDPSELNKISFQSNLFCHCILVSNENSVTGVFTRVQQYAPSSEVTMTFQDLDGKIVIGIKNSLIYEIASSLHNFSANT